MKKKTQQRKPEQIISELEKELVRKNRELEVEAALERVRSLALDMHKSEEVGNVTDRLFEELNKLTLKIIGCSIIVLDEKKDTWETWRARTKVVVKPFEVASFKRSMQLLKKHMPKWFPVFYMALGSQEKYLIEEMSKNRRTHLLNSIAEQYNYTEKEKSKLLKITPDKITAHFLFFKLGYLVLIAEKRFSKENLKVARRFVEVFDFAYRRFLDIKNAEAQAREAQIEAALERVRAKAMAMHSSDDLALTVDTFFSELTKLEIIPHRCGVGILNPETRVTDIRATTYTKEKVSKKISGELKLAGHPILDKIFETWKQQKEYHPVLRGKEILEYYKVMNPQVEFPDFANDEIQYGHYFNFKEGGVFAWTNKILSENDLQIFRRFTSVLSLTYRRYLDIKESEAQAREAQIEAALEKVRSRSLAMHKSEELQDVVNTVFERLKVLEIDMNVASIFIFKEGSKDWEQWIASSDTNYSTYFHIPYTDNIIFRDLEDAKQSGKNFYSVRYPLEEKNKWFSYAFTNTEYRRIPDNRKKFLLESGFYQVSFALSKHIGLQIAKYSGDDFSEKDNEILKRFSRVFEQAYVRFLDLQKAEAQAREAEIQLALERVRARTMAMHKSDELAETAAILFQQMTELGVTPERLNICLIKEEDNVLEVWATDQQGIKISHHFYASLDEPTTGKRVKDAWKEKKKSIIIDLSGKELNDWIRYVQEVMGMTIKPELVREHRIHSVAFFSQGLILTTTPEPLPEKSIKLLERFADVFNLTYRRFLDLQKAEAQARESQIEAALERVRGKAMAMHSSEDFVATIVAFYHELAQLSFTPRRCGVGLIDKETRIAELSTLNTTDKGDSIEIIGKIVLEGHPVLENVYNNWLTQNEYHPVLHGDEIKKYYQFIGPQIAIPDYSGDQIQYGYFFFFKEGGVYSWAEKKFTDDELQIYRRFTTVLSLTYRRYLDLKEAEARAIESVRQASLDRIRAEIASMRTSEDLNRITPVIWHELKALEVPFIRCGVFIINEETEQTHVYLSTPDGNALGVLDLAFDANTPTSNTVEYWRKKEVYKEHWNKEEFINWTKSMMELGQVQNAETYQGSSTPPESLNLHFIPFTQGMLYVGDINPLTDEKLDLVKTLAEAFSIAYARYEDFKNIEEAKNKIEITLNELKAAQAQLVHSEKMASLGELTAGIAHEIKNPLNFVNNFSEISSELIDEINEELEKNNKEEVLNILKDLKQNLEKINQHGKRADSIVKGMLLHSRGTAGERTLTDINDLLDQYVNLAYHGMRAQNKEFNITIEKDYDKTLEKIDVVPQDISRVFLNIINNACYAAYDRKKKSGDNSFFPTLTVSTKNLNGKVEIRIGDNGNGIPKDNLDKIFQPFFTTKPTGEGTGLGLSLSYDIVTKVHNGEINVETEEGKGTEFIIILHN